MAVKLRLMRMGKKKQPVYRVVAADSRSPRDGRFIEILGTYEPRASRRRVVIDNAKAVRWLQDGAQPTETVARLLTQSGAMEEFEDRVRGAQPRRERRRRPGASDGGRRRGRAGTTTSQVDGGRAKAGPRVPRQPIWSTTPTRVDDRDRRDPPRRSSCRCGWPPTTWAR